MHVPCDRQACQNVLWVPGPAVKSNTCLQARASFVKPPRQKELRYQGPGPPSVKCVKSSAAAGAQGLCCQICVKRQRGAGPKPFAVK